MKKSKILVSSLLVIALCVSLIAGTTFALFTSESNVNIAVTSGKVDVKAVLNSNVKTSSSLGDGTAMVSASVKGGQVNLTDMMPGDKVEVALSIENKSTVAVNYRVVVSAKDSKGLLGVLNVSFGGVELKASDVGYATAWDTFTADFTSNVVIEMPASVTAHQGETASLSFAVEAVQGNVDMEDNFVEESVIPVYTAADLHRISAIVNDRENVNRLTNTTVRLMNDIDMENVPFTPIGVDGTPIGKGDSQISNSQGFQGTFDGNGKTIRNLYVDVRDVLDAKGAQGNVCAGLFGSLDGTVENLTIDGATILGPHYAGGIAGYINVNNGSIGGALNVIRNCVVKNATVAAVQVVPNPAKDFDNGDKAGGIIGYLYMGEVTGCTVENVEVSAYRDAGALVGCLQANGSQGAHLNGCVATHVNVRQNLTNGYQSEIPTTFGLVFGRNAKAGKPEDVNIVVENNTVDEATVKLFVGEQAAYLVFTADQLADISANVNSGTELYAGKTVMLMDDIDLAGIDWEPIGTNADSANKFQGTFEGNNRTISNLTVDNTDEALYRATGFFGALNGTAQNLKFTHATVKGLSAPNAVGNTDNGTAIVAGSIYPSGKINNVTVEDSSVSGNRYVAGIAGYAYGDVDNCTVLRTVITANPDKLFNESWDNGDKVGGIVGYLNDDKHTLTGNTVRDCVISAWRDVGGIGGAVGVDNHATVMNNTVSGNTISFVENAEFSTAHSNKGDIIGRNMSGIALDASNKVE